MRYASKLFANCIAGNNRTFKVKMYIGGQTITPDIKSIVITASANQTDYVSIGGAVSAYAAIAMRKPDRTMENAEFALYIGLDVGGTDEFVKMGLFTVQKPQCDDDMLTFTAYDRMTSKLNRAFFSKLSYPADGKIVLKEIASMSGVPVNGLSELPDGITINKRAVVTENGVDDDGNVTSTTEYQNPFEGYTYREALGYIAQMYGKIAVINRDGEIELRWYEEVDYTITASKYYDDLITTEQYFELGRIECTTSGNTVLTSGTGAAGIQIVNPVMTQDDLDRVHRQIKDFVFLPASLSFFGDPRIDIGDIVKVNDKQGNTIKIPLMNIVQDFDGGLLTSIKSQGCTDAESEAGAAKGPTEQALDRIYTDLVVVKEIIGNKANFDYVAANLGEFKKLIADEIEATSGKFEKLSTEYAEIDLANIKQGSITTAMLGTAIVGTTQIADGSITDAKIVDLTANKITAGTLSVERLEIRGSTKSIVYALNDITGALQAKNVDTLNGEVLTPRTITADKIVAGTITSKEIAAKTITANEIDVADLFAQNITATGVIEGIEIKGGKITGTELISSKGQIGGWEIGSTGISSYATDYTVHLLNGTNAHRDVIVIKNNSNETYPFVLSAEGKLAAKNVDISGVVNATSGTFNGTVNATALKADKNFQIAINGSAAQVISASNFDTSNIASPIVNFGLISGAGRGGESAYISIVGLPTENQTGSTDTAINFYADEVNLIQGGKLNAPVRIDTPRIRSAAILNFDAQYDTAYKATTLQFFREIGNDNHRTVLRPETNGGIYLGTSSWRFNTAYFTNTITSSDLKEKDVISDFDFKLENFVMGLNPIAYRRTGKSDGGSRIHMGFGAQDVDKLLRDIGIGDMSIVQAWFSGTEGEDEHAYYGEDIDDSKLSWGLNYNEFIAPMILMLQKQQKEIEELRNGLTEVIT